jgi:hypothetical protein
LELLLDLVEQAWYLGLTTERWTGTGLGRFVRVLRHLESRVEAAELSGLVELVQSLVQVSRVDEAVQPEWLHLLALLVGL